MRKVFLFHDVAMVTDVSNSVSHREHPQATDWGLPSRVETSLHYQAGNDPYEMVTFTYQRSVNKGRSHRCSFFLHEVISELGL